MNKIMKTIALLLMGAALLSAAGCSSGGNVVASVNGETISRSDLDKRINRYKEELSRSGGADSKELMANLERQELEHMIDEMLFTQEAKKRNIEVSDGQVAAELAKEKQQFPSDAEFQEALKRYRLTEDELSGIIRTRLIFNGLYDAVTSDIQISDADVEKYYRDNPDKFKQNRQVKASHILLKTEEEAKAIIAELERGADFAQLAVQKSTDSTAAQNKGDLGYFQAEDMVKEFSDAAFSMKKGETSRTPVKSNFGYHVIRVEDIKEARQQRFDEVKDQIRVDLGADRKQERFESWFADVKAQAKIERKLPEAPAAQPPAQQAPQGSTQDPAGNAQPGK
ncbi:ppic-type ppiase domain protein, putative [Heliomicrobium modesticaldum Ice1]|uniref:peptidylprolyl isomerase n=1 Tax=Heliobacterium modesticaldum (strain ATCC 51547 / Ice1) TaxID=498761 RepID=B0TBA8_HELMI|nr:peptidylprolyl isomerase [Heliomicrobium modesticaldum]ABZ83835.1 ppic-type ppiase domain protein, putative [Heliomicrobium modesticaldum Ice1]